MVAVATPRRTTRKIQLDNTVWNSCYREPLRQGVRFTAKLGRVVIPGLPHHVTQRGARRERLFFQDEAAAAYPTLIATVARKAGTSIWSYCLMPNPVHLIMALSHGDGLRETFAEATDFAALFSHPEDEAAMGAVLRPASTGRPVSAAAWIAKLAAETRRTLAPEKRGPKPKAGVATDQRGQFKTA